MLMLRVLLCVALIVILVPEQSQAWPRFRVFRAVVRVVKIIRRCFKGDCFSQPLTPQLCDGLEKAMITREEWKAIKPLREEPMSGIPDNVVLHQTGADTCKVVGLSGANCKSCLRDESCVKQLILALQNEDLKKGKNDIGYNFLIGQDGVIYEGRGWDVVGQHIPGHDETSIGVLLLGEFSKSQPNQAMQTALNNLMLCGETAGLLSRESSFVTEPMMSGKAVDEMIRQCRGLCID